MAKQTESQQSKRSKDTIRRLQAAISKDQYDLAQQIIEALPEKDAKYLAFAMSLALFEGTTL
mgnify:FL=1